MFWCKRRRLPSEEEELSLESNQYIKKCELRGSVGVKNRRLSSEGKKVCLSLSQVYTTL